MKGFIIATQFLTRLPTPRIAFTPADFPPAMRWFPAVGLIVGLIVTWGIWAGGLVDPWVGALTGLLLWVAVTGGLHLDGLADIADARGAAHGHRERMMAALTDPHIGSFGAIAIVLLLLGKLVLVHALLTLPGPARPPWLGLVAIPFIARIGPLIWTYGLPPLHEGLASRFRGAVRPFDMLAWTGAALAASFLFPALLVALILIPLWGWWIKRHIGGISGDGHGAGIEWIEAALLMALVVGARLS
ncbi:adenosylcobinamide-GDP ribazoletransferase [Sphingobium cloacae]|uniref:adenosylcobinamide-GDP ribazoletransferase n=1 Tax=Sphingobium cloacae TaxID=120107 RepID=UPI00082F237A|nr:adenosylcobinamide-GDP ribazoletransferase [Sphingobium cloacae]